jgi:hypothetical protein
MPTIYRFSKYDISTDATRRSRRWGTLEAIAAWGGVPLKETGVEVDAAVLSSEVEGMTAIGFDPHPRERGFQRQVTAGMRGS